MQPCSAHYLYTDGLYFSESETRTLFFELSSFTISLVDFFSSSASWLSLCFGRKAGVRPNRQSSAVQYPNSSRSPTEARINRLSLRVLETEHATRAKMRYVLKIENDIVDVR